MVWNKISFFSLQLTYFDGDIKILMHDFHIQHY